VALVTVFGVLFVGVGLGASYPYPFIVGACLLIYRYVAGEISAYRTPQGKCQTDLEARVQKEYEDEFGIIESEDK